MPVDFGRLERRRETDSARFNEFRVRDDGRSPIALKYSSNKKDDHDRPVLDIAGNSGLMFAKTCPSCKGYKTLPLFLDVQCHFVELRDDGFWGSPHYGRIGDWSDVQCNVCNALSKWGQWHNEDMLCRPRDTVFKHGSLCFSYRGARQNDLVVFRATARAKDGVLIWKKNPVETKAALSKMRASDWYNPRDEAIERLLDMPYYSYVKHNQKVRTKKVAAQDALASI